MSQQHRDPAPIAGVHLVKTTSREEDSLASDVVDILQEATRGGPDCDVGGVEESYITTRDQDQMRLVEREFMHALAGRIKEVCPWVDGRKGLIVSDLRTAPGWHFHVFDRDGRPFDVQITFSEIYEIASQQRRGMLNNFRRTLDNVCEKLRDARASYFARRDAAEVH
jgi:hypothetical protein